MLVFIGKLLFITVSLGVGVYAMPARTIVLAPEPNQGIVIGGGSNKDALDIWIDQLEVKELDFNHEREKCIIDVNGKKSCGCMMFQYPTFDRFASQFGISTTTESYLDCLTQKKVAREMILENYGNWSHWYHSVIVRGLGKPPIGFGD